MDDRQNLSQPESVITTTEKSPSRNLQKKTCTALELDHLAVPLEWFQRSYPSQPQRKVCDGTKITYPPLLCMLSPEWRQGRMQDQSSSWGNLRFGLLPIDSDTSTPEKRKITPRDQPKAQSVEQPCTAAASIRQHEHLTSAPDLSSYLRCDAYLLSIEAFACVRRQDSLGALR
jgi:hypothetical protein